MKRLNGVKKATILRMRLRIYWNTQMRRAVGKCLFRHMRPAAHSDNGLRSLYVDLLCIV